MGTSKKRPNSFGTAATLTVKTAQGGTPYRFHSLKTFAAASGVRLERLPFSLKILLENLLRHEDGIAVKKKDIEALANWKADIGPDTEIQFMPARVLLQDFTGVPAVADLAAMRGAIKKLGGDPDRINPISPADLIIDHSVQVDEYGTANALKVNSDLDFDRNGERYEFLKWGQTAFKNFKVVPPETGICHQVNLEYLSRVAMTSVEDGETWVFPDTLVGTDSHTTMINGLGVLGWGVGGIEAEAALLGQPCSMLIPNVVGFKLMGRLSPGTTATDLVLTVTEMLRKRGVVGKFVEFHGPGLSSLSLADRATIANMAPEYGATCGLFPVDAVTVEYLKLTGREELVPLVESYFQEQGLWYAPHHPEPEYSDRLELDLSHVEPSIAGPSRPQDRVPLKDARVSFRKVLGSLLSGGLSGQAKAISPEVYAQWTHLPSLGTPPELNWNAEDAEKSKMEASSGSQGGIVRELLHGGRHAKSSEPDYGALEAAAPVKNPDGLTYHLRHGSVVIAAITSCTNTSNPSVLIAAGLLAKNAIQRGLRTRPWVKTSLAPGSKVVTDYLVESGLMPYLEALRFNLVGYGCTTCIGNSGPLPEHIAQAVTDHELAVAAVLSGNRNFEGRINTLVRGNYLASPPLVVAYALAGNMSMDMIRDPLGTDAIGKPVYLKDIWPSVEEVNEVMKKFVTSAQFKKSYANVFSGPPQWRKIQIPTGDLYKWDKKSTYIKEPPFFARMEAQPAPLTDIRNARVLALLGDSVTTDHISPAGSFSRSTPAGQYLQSLGVDPKDFNSYGSRRGNHEVMARGTFANVRLKNFLVPGIEGGVTLHLGKEGHAQQMSIYEASMRYQADSVPLIVVAGKEYGTGSSRDWAAKGPKLLGIRAVIAESFERIHRSNLVGMGILPLQFARGETAQSLSLTGKETFDVEGIAAVACGGKVTVKARCEGGEARTFTTLCRIDTPNELEYFRHGGILTYVLRQTLVK